ncbi:MAG: protein serine/threonine phosphatase 2C family protein [Bdellovibrionales bacterium]|nr:protein serine/threonine phosphatase 2C family protein [Bdellovibrionales bacterium]
MGHRVPIQGGFHLTQSGARPIQEDHVLTHAERGIWAVADGFGGQGAGDVAAKTACESVQSFLEKEAGDEDATLPFEIRQYFSLAGNVLFNALIHANRQVLTLNKNKSANEKGGASLLAAYLDGDLLALSQVGCTQAHLFRGDQRRELVIPKSYSRLVDPMENSSLYQAPLMAIGITSDLEPEVSEIRVRKGDFVVLATDGLGAAGLEQIAAYHRQWQSGSPLALVLDQAFQKLKSQGYDDNMALILLAF